MSAPSIPAANGLYVAAPVGGAAAEARKPAGALAWVAAVRAVSGLPSEFPSLSFLSAVTVFPAICEELLFRGYVQAA
jgi:membrane protease YdiL (CAAX protease family)